MLFHEKAQVLLGTWQLTGSFQKCRLVGCGSYLRGSLTRGIPEQTWVSICTHRVYVTCRIWVHVGYIIPSIFYPMDIGFWYHRKMKESRSHWQGWEMIQWITLWDKINDNNDDTVSGWRCGTFFSFSVIGNKNPNWQIVFRGEVIVFRGVETTNQMLMFRP